MADDARQSLPDLAGPDPDGADGLSEIFDFFELLRRLERSGRLFGHTGGPAREPARLGQHIRLAFATQDLAAFQAAEGKHPARVTVANIGLLGPEGPMPLHLTRWVLDRLSQRWFAGAEARHTSDTTFVDFLNTLQHRFIALFYRAWADATPAAQVERGAGGRMRAMLGAMAGIGLPDTQSRDDPGLDVVKLRQAAALASQIDGPERLTLLVAQAFGVPARLKEFVASWLSIPTALQSRLGKAHAGLGRSAVIGPRSFSRQSRVELEIGPLDLATYMAFLPGSRRLGLLRRTVRDLNGLAVDVDLRLVLARAEIPRARLGSAQLSRTAWLAPPKEREDARDMLLRSIVGWRAEMAEVGA